MTIMQRVAPPPLRAWILGSPEGAERRLERAQPTAGGLPVLRSGTSRGTLGVDRGASDLQRGEHITDPDQGILVRGGLQHFAYSIWARSSERRWMSAHRAAARKRRGRRGSPRRSSHRRERIRQHGVDDPGPPACRRRRTTACGARNRHHQADEYERAEQYPEPDKLARWSAGRRRGPPGLRGQCRRCPRSASMAGRWWW